jgi:peptide deformylase
VDATEKDKQVVTAAKMIGVKKNIIVVAAGPFQFAMINPVITRKSGAFETEEGCLSLDGVRSCTRYEEIEVDHCNGIVI